LIFLHNKANQNIMNETFFQHQKEFLIDFFSFN